MSVKACFNKAAENYDLYCNLQLITGEKLLSLIEPAENIIDLGCGTGNITSKLKFKNLYALDISEKMLTIARQRLGDKNITYIEASFDNFSNLKLDLAFANMSLQWSTDLKSTLNNIRANLKPNGMLVFSIPLLGTLENLNIPTISFFSFSQVEKLLHDWHIIHSSSQEFNYYFLSLVEALKSIKAVGANYYNSPRKNFISRNKTITNLKYNIGYFVARN